MRKIALPLLIATAALAAGPRGGNDNTVFVTVKDAGINTSWAVVNSDTGAFTQIAADTTIRVAFASESRLDSLRTGNAGGGTATAIWSGGSTADTAGTNFFQDRGQTSPSATATGVFGSGFSSTWGSYLTRVEDTDFQLTGSWTISCWAKGSSPGNPGLTTKQVAFSAYSSSDIVEIGFDQNGYIYGRLSDDTGSNWDSIGVKADKYDGQWHWVTFQALAKAGHAANKDSIRLTVDDSVRSVVFSSASTAMTVDSVSAFSYAGTSILQGMMDEIWYLEDSITVDLPMRNYAWRAGREALGFAADSAAVHITGIGTDSVKVDTLLKVPVGSPAVTARRWHAFELAFLDSHEAMPVVVYTSATSPRATQLDSIPAGSLIYDAAHLFAGKGGRSDLVLTGVTFQHEGAIDSTDWELRVYPSLESSRSLSNGYWVAATARLHQDNTEFTKPLNLELTAGPKSSAAFVAIYAKGTAATKGAATITARRR